MGVATYTHLGNANNALCREAEKSVYKTCVSRMSSPETRLRYGLSRMQDNPFIAVRWVKVADNQFCMGYVGCHKAGAYEVKVAPWSADMSPHWLNIV